MNTLLFALKTLTDVCYYMIFAAFAAGQLGVGGLPAQAALLIAVGVLCRLLDGAGATAARAPVRAGLRFLPLLLLALLPLLPGGGRAALFCLPPALYLGFTAARRLFDTDAGEQADRFSLFLKLLPLPLLGALIFGAGTAVRDYSFPYLMLFLFCSVLLLRMLRHDPEVQRQRRFRVLNALELCAALLLAAALFSKPFRACVAAAAGALYRLVLAPVLLLISYVFVGLGWLLSQLLAPLDMSGRELPELEMMEAENLAEQLTNELGDGAPVWGRILLALGLALAGVLLFLLFRRMLGRRAVPRDDSGRVTRTALAEEPRPTRERRLFARRSAAEQVRRSYLHYLRLARAHGARLTAYQNTAQQRDAAGDRLPEPAAQDALRTAYLPARYGGQAGEDDVRAAKAAFETVKKSAR